MHSIHDIEHLISLLALINMSRILLAAPLPFCFAGNRHGLNALPSPIAFSPSSHPAISGFKVSRAGLISPIDLVSVVNEPSYDQAVLKWKAPRLLKISDDKFIKVRLTAVDGAFQLYGYLREDRHEIHKMSAHFRQRYEEDFHPEDTKEEWGRGEACVAKLLDSNEWYRCQVIELNEWTSEVGIIYVDLGIVRVAKISDIRIARAFGDKVSSTQFS